MQILLRWIAGAVALYLTVMIGQSLHMGLALAPGTNGIASALVMVLVLTLVNAVVRPVALFFFSGLNCLTLGLFSFVVNALMFLLAGYIGQQLGLGFRVNGFVPALFGSIVLSLLSGVIEALFPSKGKS